MLSHESRLFLYPIGMQPFPSPVACDVRSPDLVVEPYPYLCDLGSWLQEHPLLIGT